MKFAVVYIHETKECALMELTASVENSIKEAIAAQTRQNPARINVFNLFELTTKFWAVRFSGKFTKRNRDGAAWTGKGDMFFYPELVAGVVLTEKFPVLADLSEQVTAYVEAGQKYYDGQKAAPAQPPAQGSANGFSQPVIAPPMNADAFPTEEPPVEIEDMPF